MISKEPPMSARDFFPPRISLSSLRKAAKACQGCHLYKDATQTVFSQGPGSAALMIIGEIPGDIEDKTGEPFTGPAGIFMRKMLDKVNIAANEVYFTNAVKHFKFIQTQQRRLHRSPVASEIKACHPWLEQELVLIQPRIVLCLGVVAAKTFIKQKFLLSKQRGKWVDLNATSKLIITFHPSAILRASDDMARKKMKNLFLRDLKKVAIVLSNNQN